MPPVSTFYPELLDTTFSEPSHVVAGDFLLKMLVIGRARFDLPTVHGYHSPAILDHCARDESFIDLVEKGWLRFRVTHSGLSPRSAFREALLDENVYLKHWLNPFLEPGLSQSDQKDFRREVHDAIFADRVVSEEVLGSRVERTRKLLAAIDQYEYRTSELPLGDRFSQSLQRKLARIDALDHDARSIADALISNGHTNRRSAVYYALDRFEDMPLARERIRKLADTTTVELTAYSLQTGIYGLSHDSPLIDAHFKEIGSSPAALIVKEISIEAAEVDRARDLDISWKDVHDLVAARDPKLSRSRLDVERAIEKLSTIVASKRAYSLKRVELGAGLATKAAAAGGAALIEPTGALYMFIADTLTGSTLTGWLSRPLARHVHERLEAPHRSAARAELTGWLGSLDPEL